MMEHVVRAQNTKTARRFLLFVLAVGVVAVWPANYAHAETPISITCKDGKTVTAIRTSEAFTLDDYKTACKDHGGYEDTGTYVDVSKPTTSSGTTVTTSLSNSGNCPPDSILGIPAWYSGLRVDPSAGNCELKPVGDSGMSLSAFIVKIALNVIRAGLVLAGYIAVFFIIKGGFGYIMAQGEPSNLTAAKQTITNAIIGLIIALLSAAIVGAIAGVIK